MRTRDELVKLVSQKTGLAEGMAKAAVETVVGFLKESFRPPSLNKSTASWAVLDRRKAWEISQRDWEAFRAESSPLTIHV